MIVKPVVSRRPQRFGYTLIEMLVVVMVIGVLVVLMFPAVQSARETSRKIQCANNLRQLGIAMNSYASRMGTFPAGANGRGYSLHTMILPDLEQHSLYSSINLKIAANEEAMDAPNITAMCTSLRYLICPSDRTTYGSVAWTNYAGNKGIYFPGRESEGVFANHAFSSLQGITDGLSNTVCASEWVLSPEELQARDAKGSIFAVTKFYSAPGEFDLFVNECNSIDYNSAKINGNTKGRNWLYGEFGYTLYNHAAIINGHSCLSESAVQQGIYSAGSRHPGGGHTLMADGHARFVGDSVALKVWRALGTRNGGENINITTF